VAAGAALEVDLRALSNSACVIGGALGLVLWYIGSLASGEPPAW
jgi:hypothetical protein